MGWFIKKQNRADKEIFIKLNDEAFRCLTRGGAVYCCDVRIVLSDISFGRMQNAIDMAASGVDAYINYELRK